MQDQNDAIRLLEEQRTKLVNVRALDFRNPQFISWRDATTLLFQRLLPQDSPHSDRFRNLRWHVQGPVRRLPFNYRGPAPPLTPPISAADKERFTENCAIAENCINGAIEEIRNFGVHSETPKPVARRGGGVQQNFHGPVVIESQAIATDHALQNIGEMGGVGSSLREIKSLLDESMELTGREKLDGLRAIETIAAEVQKPAPRRDWKSILDWGEKLTSIANKATDVATKLAPHLPALLRLSHEATKMIQHG